jgi:DNA-directed RNA polymerase subunit RPC12/RpoP
VQRDDGDDDNPPPKKFGFRGGPVDEQEEPSSRAKLKHVEPEEDDRPKKFGFKSGPVEEPEEGPSYDSNNTGPLSMEMEDAGQLKCKKCGSTKVAEVEDKDQVIAFSPRIIYGTKYRCMTCRNEWV